MTCYDMVVFNMIQHNIMNSQLLTKRRGNNTSNKLATCPKHALGLKTPAKAHFTGWAKHHFNNLHFNKSIETKNNT